MKKKILNDDEQNLFKTSGEQVFFYPSPFSSITTPQTAIAVGVRGFISPKVIESTTAEGEVLVYRVNEKHKNSVDRYLKAGNELIGPVWHKDHKTNYLPQFVLKRLKG